MKNKVLVLLGVLILIVAAYGCSNKENAINETTQKETENDVWLKSLVPNPEDYFKSSTIETYSDSKKIYSTYIYDFEKSEYDAYVDACIDMGFDDPMYKFDTGFGAYTSDKKYCVYVDIDNNAPNDPVVITCVPHEEHEDETEE